MLKIKKKIKKKKKPGPKPKVNTEINADELKKAQVEKIEDSEFANIVDELQGMDTNVPATNEDIDKFDSFFTGETMAIVERRKKVFRLKLSNISNYAIANLMQVSVHTIINDVKSIKASTKRSVDTFDWPLYIGEAIQFFGEIQAQAIRVGQDVKKETTKDRMSAYRLALDAKEREINFFQKLGVVGQNTSGSLKGKDSNTSKEVSEFGKDMMDMMKKRAKEIKEGLVIEVKPKEAEDVSL